jgi:hypothetical protein
LIQENTHMSKLLIDCPDDDAPAFNVNWQEDINHCGECFNECNRNRLWNGAPEIGVSKTTCSQGRCIITECVENYEPTYDENNIIVSCG